MEKRVVELQKDIEKETEKLKLTREIYDKELEKAERALEEESSVSGRVEGSAQNGRKLFGIGHRETGY